MAKPTPKTKETPALEVSLDDFCKRLSRTDSRYTLIAAFHLNQTKASKLRDTASAYQERFEKYINTPAI
ncbi:hypothetical protein GTB64_004479 [Salmonella enterica]|nr:hypothetical protein [Salmonella enterica]